MQAVTLTNNSTTNKRRELDFYPTPANVTVALMNFLQLPKQKIWEPACGDGAMSVVIQQFGHDVHSSDIRAGYGEQKDFLESTVECDSIITNPPFNLSERFIVHAMTIAKLNICMLVESQYWHASKRAKLFNSYPPSWVLALTWRPDFMNGERGGAPTMECCWIVWNKGNNDTRYRLLNKP